MLDCGIHPGFSGMNSLPFFDEIDMDSVDAMLITHFHLDHCAAVPYVVGKTAFKARRGPIVAACQAKTGKDAPSSHTACSASYHTAETRYTALLPRAPSGQALRHRGAVAGAQGRILMTHPTKAIYGTLLRDFVKVSRGGSEESLYSDKDLERALERSEVLDFHQTIDLDGIKARARPPPPARAPRGPAPQQPCAAAAQPAALAQPRLQSGRALQALRDPTLPYNLTLDPLALRWRR